MKRRQFLQKTVATAGGLLSLPALKACSGGIKNQLGLQLYTLRDQIVHDPKGVLKKVSEFGYKKLETFSYEGGMIFGMTIKEFGNYVEDLGMKVISGHYGLDMTRGDGWKKAIDDAHSIGQEYMVVPWLEEKDRQNMDDYKRVFDQLNRAGQVCKQHGIGFGYHNHDFEFQEMEGKVPFEIMLAELDSDLVSIEMDIYWVVRAGEDPVRLFNAYPGRFEQWHVKDMDKNDPDRNADIGTGTIDYKALFDQAGKSGMKHWYVEQESYPGNPMKSVEASANFLKTGF